LPASRAGGGIWGQGQVKQTYEKNRLSLLGQKIFEDFWQVIKKPPIARGACKLAALSKIALLS